MQKKAAKTLAERGGSIGQAMRDAGYSDISSKTPKKLTDSIGFREICEKVGLTDDLILKSLSDDINQKPRNRVQELNLAAKIKGMLIDRTETKTLNVNVDITPEMQKIADKYEEELRQAIYEKE